jgi:hypothetical protein
MPIAASREPYVASDLLFNNFHPASAGRHNRITAKGDAKLSFAAIWAIRESLDNQ